MTMARLLNARAAAAGLLFIAGVQAVVNQPAIADEPYEETIPMRMPFSKMWQTTPTGWTNLPCTSASSIAAASNINYALCEEGLISLNPLSTLTGVDNSWSTLASSDPAYVPPFLIAANSTNAASVQCSAAACTQQVLISGLQIGSLNTAYAYPSATRPGWWTLWLGGTAGVSVYDVQVGQTAVELWSAPVAVNAVSASAALSMVAAGNNTAMMLYDMLSLSLVRWEWVSDVVSGAGGVYDDVTTALAFDHDILYAGNPTCLNVRYPNASVYRFSDLEGLPSTNITALAVDVSSAPLRPAGSRRLWIGTLQGVVLFDPTAPMRPAQPTLLPNGQLSVPSAQRWRYFRGSRWLATAASNTMASTVVLGGLLPLPQSQPAAGVAVLTTTGITMLQSQQWTLQQKAGVIEAQTAGVDLHGLGLTTSCTTATFGLTANCSMNTDDNSGLWTSLNVVAQSMKYIVTGDAAAAAQASHYLEGMHLLNRVTGITGLFARCALPPGVPPPSAPATAAAVAAKQQQQRRRNSRRSTGAGVGMAWHNSSSMPGYTWEGDTSSDEVCGHMMAYTLASQLLADVNSTAAALAGQLLVNITRYIVENNFTLVDVTGQPTTWGKWSPAYVNWDRSWSDQRGLNSVQMLGLLLDSQGLVPAGSADWQLFQTALDYLVQQEGYADNMVNAKIAAPSDDNYSDDELAYFAYYALLNAAPAVQANNSATFTLATNSMLRTWRLIRFTRPSLWHAMTLGTAGAALTAPDYAALSDIAFNLRTWPVEQLDWPVVNSDRADLSWLVDPEVNRDFQHSTDSVPVVPANERCTARWNSDERTMDGGSGYNQQDGGAFLLPYWMSRYYGFLTAAAAASD